MLLGFDEIPILSPRPEIRPADPRKYWESHYLPASMRYGSQKM